jgi:hypothetical protein
MFEKAIRFKLVDQRGRTLSRFSKRSYFDAQMQPKETEPWVTEAKPQKRPPNATPAHEGRLPPLPIRHADGGQRYLEVPGLTLKWDKVTPVLERIALAMGLVDASGVVLVDDLDAATLTTEQLRTCIG